MRMKTEDLITREECLTLEEAIQLVSINNLRYYVYFLVDPFSYQIKYVGKGSGNRLSYHWEDFNQNSRKQSWLNKLRKRDKPYLVSIWEFYEKERLAYEQESNFIYGLGRYKIDNKGTLLNVQSENDTHLYHSNKWRDTEQFIQEARKIHKDKFDYSSTVYKRADEKVQITCKECGVSFKQLAIGHLKGSGCLNCVGANNKKRFSKTTEQFIEEAEKKFPDKFSYSQSIYLGAREKIKIWCKACNKPINPQASSFLNSKFGCKSCSMKNNKNRW